MRNITDRGYSCFLNWLSARTWVIVFSFCKVKVDFQNLIYFWIWYSCPVLWNVCSLYFPSVTGGISSRCFLDYHPLLIWTLFRILGYLSRFYRSSPGSHEFQLNNPLLSSAPLFPRHWYWVCQLGVRKMALGEIVNILSFETLLLLLMSQMV